MTTTSDVQLRVQTDDGPVTALISQAALSKLAGRSHVTPDEIILAHRIELEDIVRVKLRGADRSFVRSNEGDL